MEKTAFPVASSASQKHCKLMFRTFDHVGTILQIQLTQNAVKISSQVPLIHYNASEVHKSSAPFKKNQICLLKRKSVHQKLKIETTTMLLAICYPTLRKSSERGAVLYMRALCFLLLQAYEQRGKSCIRSSSSDQIIANLVSGHCSCAIAPRGEAPAHVHSCAEEDERPRHRRAEEEGDDREEPAGVASHLPGRHALGRP